MKTIYNKTAIAKFYHMVENANFDLLSDETISLLDYCINKWHYAFYHNTAGLLTRMTLTAEKMTTSNGYLGPKSIEEKLYFYIRMVDPDFLFLEAYEACNKTEELVNCCKLNFHIYDPYLIKFERELYKRLNLKDDLWSLERIKKNR